MATGGRAPEAAPSRTEFWALAALLVGAAALRWVAWERTAVLFSDGPRFIAIARAFDAGAWSAGLSDAFHPLYPALVAAAHRALPGDDSPASWEAAAAGLSALAGTAAVGLLFVFLRDAFGRAPAWCGAVLLAVHGRAVEYASDVQSDALYLALFAAGLALGWRAWRRVSVSMAAGAGAAAGLAYLTRPEGIGLVLVLGALAAYEALRRCWPPGRSAAWLAALAGAAALCVLPYLVALHGITGGWTLTQKKSVPGLAGHAAEPPWSATLGAAVPPEVDPLWVDPEYRESDGMRVATAPTPAARAVEASRMLGRTGLSALGFGVLALVAVGLFAARGRPGPRGVFVAALALLYAGVLYGLTAGAGYVSRRHALPPLLPLFGYAGLGALALGAWGGRILGGTERARLACVVAILAGVAAGEASRHLEPKRADELAARLAAEWLRANAPAAGTVAAPRPRLGYYAGMPYVPIAGIADAALGAYLSRAGARYVLLDDAEQVQALLRTEGSQVRLLHQIEAGGEQAWVLERLAPTRRDAER